MSSASLTLAFTPLLDERIIAVMQRRAVLAVRLLGMIASSLAVACTLWLILAGPGFLTDQASTVSGRGRTVAQR